MRARRSWRRFGAFDISVGLALAVHAMALFAMRSLSESPRAVLPVTPRPYVDVSLLLPLEAHDEETRQASADGRAPTDGPASAEAQSRTRATTGAVASLEWPSPKSGDQAEATMQGEASDGAKPPAEPGPSLSLNQLGIGDQNPFLGDRPKADAPGSAESRLNESLRAEIADADVHAGLTRGGPVISALRLATFEVATPNNGTASFLARTDATGLVVSLEPTDVSSHYAAWQKVARRALGQLKGKRLRVPDGSQGLSVRLEVVSRIQLPSGRDPGLGVSALGLPIKKGDGEHSTRIDILKPSVDLRSIDVPGTTGADPHGLPTLRLGVNLFGLDADPVDVGAKAQRIVRVRVVNERPL